MKKTLLTVLALVLALTVSGAAIADSALDAFNSLVSSNELTFGTDANALLDEVVAGAYSTPAADFASAQTYSAKFSALSSVSAGQIASYAASKGLPVGQVRNAYYRALANVLSAEIMVNPASEDKYRNIQSVLSLFLEHGTDVGAVSERANIRSSITRTNVEQIAQDYQLPVSFVEFLIMDDDWYDDLWENDDDWYEDVAWYNSNFSGGDLRVGSRDSATSTEVAAMQQALISLNYLTGKADGIFGPRTEAALIEFQLANGLNGSGVYDTASRNVLNSGSAVARTDYVENFYAGYNTGSSSGSSSQSGSSSKYVDRTPDNTPDRTPDRTPDKTPDRSPDRTPDRT